MPPYESVIEASRLTVLLGGSRQLHFEVWGLLYSPPKIEPFSAFLFLVTWGETTESTSHRHWANGPAGIWYCFPQGRWHCEPLWTVSICIAQQQSSWHWWKVETFRTFLLQCQQYANLPGVVASFFMLPILSCVSLYPISHSFAQSEPFFCSIIFIFMKCGLSSGSDKSLPTCYVPRIWGMTEWKKYTV